MVDCGAIKNSETRFWTKLNLLAEIASSFRAPQPLRRTVEEVLTSIKTIIPFKAAGLYLYDNKNNRLRRAIKLGPLNSVKVLQRDFERGNIESWFSIKSHGSIIRGEVGEQLLIIPLTIHKKPIGLIVFESDNSRPFREKDSRLLFIAGDLIAVSLERQIYNKKLVAKNLELLKTQKELKVVRQKVIDDERLAAVKELAISINHEINNPLSVIVGNIQCLVHKASDLDEGIGRRLSLIETEAMRIAEINQRLLTINDLVSETYMKGKDKIRMIDINKSTSGVGQ